MPRHVGLDFGTTNTSVAVVDGDGPPRLARYPSFGDWTTEFRSLLYFQPARRGNPILTAGPGAIRLYLDSDSPGRLIQSLKSYLAARSLRSTAIFHKVYRLEELVAGIFTQLREQAEQELGPLGHRAVVGRPVRFVDSQDEDNDLFAVERLRDALALAGFDEVRFEYEPVAAAHAYQRRLSRSEQVLIADFGGGTTDFSLVKLMPLVAGGTQPEVEILGSTGVPIAGDCFDGRLVAAVVAPALGQGTDFTSSLGRDLPVPNWVYVKLRRWHHVSFLRNRKTQSMLDTITRRASAPTGLRALCHLIQNDLGFSLHRAVQQAKFALSNQTQTELVFDDDPIDIREPVTREQFDHWITEDLAVIEEALHGLLERCGVVANSVDVVFMTGGSSLVPAVRKIFARLFGASKLRGGEELTTVASGLAHCAADQTDWA